MILDSRQPKQMAERKHSVKPWDEFPGDDVSLAVARGDDATLTSILSLKGEDVDGSPILF